MKQPNLKICTDLAKKYNINIQIVPIETIKYAIKVELEHGKKFGKITNIINDSYELAFRIALAHLNEDPYYYKFLKKMEDQRDKYWSKKSKPSIFNKLN